MRQLSRRIAPVLRLLRYAPYLYFIILTPCLIYTVFYTARAIRFDYIVVPTWDAWRCVHDLDQLCNLDLRPLWIQHYEHRVIVVEILYWLDFVLLDGRQWIPIACEIVCQAAQLALLWCFLKRIQTIPIAFRLALGASCGLLMATAIHVQVILIPFLVQWYLSQALAALALVSLWHSARTGRLASLVITFGAAVAITYTTGNGMLLWLVLVLMAALLRIPKKRLAGLAIIGTITSAMYFAGYVFVGEGRAANVLSHPLYTVGFVCVFLGAPASYISNLFGGTIGMMGLLLAALALLLVFRERRLPDLEVVVPAGVCLYIVCSAFLIAYGRINPANPTFIKAKSERYASVPLTFWANLVILGVWLVTRLPRGRRFALHFFVATLTVVILVAVMGQQASCERAFAKRYALGEEADIALLTRAENREVLAAIHQDPAFVLAETPVLRRRRLSLFAAGRQDWIGRPISQLFGVGPPDVCFGSMDNPTEVTNAYRVEGWAWDPSTNRAPRDIVLTNSSDIIVGLGETRHGGYPHSPADRARRPSSDLDWAGFAPPGRLFGSLRAYAIVGGGRIACPLGVSRRVPLTARVDGRRVGTAIPISEWHADPAWTRNGFHSSVGTLAGETLYGSYSGSDVNQGTLTSEPFETGGGNCVVLPVAHGPSTIGQSVRLVDAGGGGTVATIPLGRTDGTWQYWSIDLENTHQLRIVAADKGSDWGEWVAVGEPHRCQP